jgi:hypothetical protein
MEIKIHGYKLDGVKYEIKLNWNRNPVEASINGGRIDMLEAKQGRKKVLRYENGEWIIPVTTEHTKKILEDVTNQFN